MPAALRPVTIDAPSAVWAYDLGWKMREETRSAGGATDHWCPFRLGTPQRVHWLFGWRHLARST